MSTIAGERPETATDSMIDGTASEFSTFDNRDDLFEETVSIMTTNSDEEVPLQVISSLIKIAKFLGFLFGWIGWNIPVIWRL